MTDNNVRTYNAAGYDLKETPLKYVFELPQGGYAEIAYDLSVWNKDYGNGKGSIYVNDRPKSFSPVGYTSTVDFSNKSGVEDAQQDDGYAIYPNYEWFYYSDTDKKYIELNSLSTFEKPVTHIPTYYRSQLQDQLNKELWAIVEVAKQTAALPNADYTPVNTPNNETLVYSVAFYDKEVSKTTKDSDFPTGMLNGKHTIYARP